MSNKKEELLSILDSFNIQVSAALQPFCITLVEQHEIVAYPDRLDWYEGVSS